MSRVNDFTWDPTQGIQFASPATSQATFATKATLPVGNFKSRSKSRSVKPILFSDLETVESTSVVPNKLAPAPGSSNNTKATPGFEKRSAQKAQKARAAPQPSFEVPDSRRTSDLSREYRGQAARGVGRGQSNSRIQDFKRTTMTDQLQVRKEQIAATLEARRKRQALHRHPQDPLAGRQLIKRSSKSKSTFVPPNREAFDESINNEAMLSKEIPNELAWLDSDIEDIEDIGNVSNKITPDQKADSLSAAIRAARDPALRSQGIRHEYEAKRLPFDIMYDEILHFNKALMQESLLHNLSREIHPDGTTLWLLSLRSILHAWRNTMKVRISIERNPACWGWRDRSLMLKDHFDTWQDSVFLAEDFFHEQLKEIARFRLRRVPEHRRPFVKKIRAILPLIGNNRVFANKNELIEYRNFLKGYLPFYSVSPVDVERSSRMKPLWDYLIAVSSVTRELTGLNRLVKRKNWSSALFKHYLVRKDIFALSTDLEECVWESLTDQYQKARERGVQLIGRTRSAESNTFHVEHGALSVSDPPKSPWGLSNTSRSGKGVKPVFLGKPTDEETEAMGSPETSSHFTPAVFEDKKIVEADISSRSKEDSGHIDSRDFNSDRVNRYRLHKQLMDNFKKAWISRIKGHTKAHTDLAYAISRLQSIVTMSIGRSDDSREDVEAFNSAWRGIEKLERIVGLYAREAEWKGFSRQCTLCGSTTHWTKDCHFLKYVFRNQVFDKLLNNMKNSRQFQRDSRVAINRNMIPKPLRNIVGIRVDCIKSGLKKNIFHGRKASFSLLHFLESEIDRADTANKPLTRNETTEDREWLAQRYEVIAEMLQANNNHALEAYTSFLDTMKTHGIIQDVPWPLVHEEEAARVRDYAENVQAALQRRGTDGKDVTSSKDGKDTTSSRDAIYDQGSVPESGSTEPSRENPYRGSTYLVATEQHDTNTVLDSQALSSVDIVIEQDEKVDDGELATSATAFNTKQTVDPEAASKNFVRSTPSTLSCHNCGMEFLSGDGLREHSRESCQAHEAQRVVPLVVPDTKAVTEIEVVPEETPHRVKHRVDARPTESAEQINPTVVARRVSCKAHGPKPEPIKTKGTEKRATDKQRIRRQNGPRFTITKIECDNDKAKPPNQRKDSPVEHQTSQARFGIQRYTLAPQAEKQERKIKHVDLSAHENVGTPSLTFKPTQSLASPSSAALYPVEVCHSDVLQAHCTVGTWQAGQSQEQGQGPTSEEPIIVAKNDPPPHIPLSYQIPEAVKREKMLASLSTAAAYWSFDLYRGPTGEKVKVHYCKSKETTERVAQYFLNQTVLGFDIEWKAQAAVKDGVKKNVSLIQIACQDRIALFHIARYQQCR